jgi:osmotically-inducible protein OsmY
VNDLATRDFAVWEAEKIDGALAVIDQIVVSPGFHLDTDIANAVRRRILNSAVIDSQGLKVLCKDGVVTLSGEVTSYVEQQQAGLLASEVCGVREVKNNILTKWTSTRNDQEIKADAVAALERDVYLTGLPITVTVREGELQLSGTVGNAYEKRRAYDAVRWVSNVKSVDNELTVTWYENHGVRDGQTTPSDGELQVALRKTLDQDSRVRANNIALRVLHGHVTLDGSVYSHYERDVAERDAKNVVGVVWVTNHLFAQVDRREDWAIENDIRFNLKTDFVTDDFDLDVSVRDGTATLTGTVDTWYERAHAYDVVSRVRGVKTVHNSIRVSSSSWKKDAELVTSIKSRLKGDWTTWWVLDKINVTVKDGVATLEGDVNSWDQRHKAGELALHTAGISEVDNRLTVKGVGYPWDEHHHES